MKQDHSFPIRVRFAPSPTGFMHLGNVRTALLNFLFARKTGGTFIVRIEDTDPARNFDPGAQQIQQDLQWLGLSYQEGPEIGGPYEPYFQSQRSEIYQDYLLHLIHKEAVYRCFCSSQELEKKRARQIALKQPPRYDRTCLSLSESQIAEKIALHEPFLWRMKLDPQDTLTIIDLARGPVRFEMRNFSDFPISRPDGTFTFMFANFVDDASMRMSHVLRGEDHLSNTAGQAALYAAAGVSMPTFWHLPILCNAQGAKLSKRDFGFALRDLRASGYVPEAIVNYLAIIGGGSFTQEIMSLDELAQAIDFDNIHATGQVRYDLEKLRWVNQKWIQRYDLTVLTRMCMPYITERFPETGTLPFEYITTMIALIRPDMKTVRDVQDHIACLLHKPDLVLATDLCAYASTITSFLHTLITQLPSAAEILTRVKEYAKQHAVPAKELFHAIRIALTGKTDGPSLPELFTVLESIEITTRLQRLVEHLRDNCT